MVRTRKVRAIEERFYGRVGRTIVIGNTAVPDGAQTSGFLMEAQHEAVVGPDKMLATIRRARIPADRAAEFFSRVAELADEFTTLPRDGDVVHGFVAAVYPTAHPTLPDPLPDSPADERTATS